MKAGRELDALVAEKVLGLNVVDYRQTAKQPIYYWPRSEYEAIGRVKNDEPYIFTGHEPAGMPLVRYIPHYSTQMADAWPVVEEMNNRDMGMELYRFNSAVMPKAHECRFYEDYDGYWSANADTAPLAICLAALKAVGYEVPA